MLYELFVLAQYVADENGLTSTEDVLRGLCVVVTHIKPTFEIGFDTQQTTEIIKNELTNPENESYAKLGVNFIIPAETAMIYAKSGKITTMYIDENSAAINTSFPLYLFRVVSIFVFVVCFVN